MPDETVPARVVVDGDVVRRPAQAWTPTVHALLRHLRAAGSTEVPEPLAIRGGLRARLIATGGLPPRSI